MFIYLHGVHGCSGPTIAECRVETMVLEAVNIYCLASYRKSLLPSGLYDSILYVYVFIHVLIYNVQTLFVKKPFRNCLLGQWQGIPRQSLAISLEAGGNSGDFRMRRKDRMAWERKGIPRQRQYEIKV